MRTDGLLADRIVVRSSKYLNNLIEQDHRSVKSRTRPMLGFKIFESAAIAIAGVELLRRIHKDQFALNRLPSKVKLRPPSGMLCLSRRSPKTRFTSHHLAHSGYLHHSPQLEPSPPQGACNGCLRSTT